MSAYSMYDVLAPKWSREQRIRGGRARAKMPRDRWGRLLPTNGTPLPVPVCHGREGGLKRGQTGKREKGRYVK